MKTKYIPVILVCLVLGLLLALQFRVVQKDYLGGMIPSTRLDKLNEEVGLLREEKAKLLSSVDELQTKLNELVAAETEDNTLLRTLNDELEKYKMFSGFTNIQGPGVAVYLDNAPEGEEQTNLVSDYNLVLFVVNELSAAGAEAISINSQRYTSNTEVRGAGDSIVVNGVAVKPPIIIKAIGDKSVLQMAIEQRFGLAETIRKRGYQCDVNTVEDLRIDRSNEVIEWHYAKPVKDK